MNPKTDAREHFALIPRDVVVHRMETADCFESRVFWAIILWSWCGPDASDAFVVKNARGFIQRDSAENPIYGRDRDILRLLGLSPERMKGNLSRALQRLDAKGSIRYEGKILYPVKAPPRAEDTQKVADLTTFTIAGIVVRSDNFPTDPTERAETVQWITELKSEYNNAVTTVRSGYRKLLKQGLSERGILIVLKEKNSREEEEPAPPPSEIDSESVHRSVGRSSPEPTDRPTPESTESLDPPEPSPPAEETAETPLKEGTAALPYAPAIRQWLEEHVKIPGFPLEDPELRAIASTIHTAADLEQFQKAASRQANPRGWRVYVKIAQQCAACRPAYSQAAVDPPGTSPPIDVNSLILDLGKGKPNGR